MSGELAMLPEEQHKATEKRSEIVLAINFGGGAERNRSKHLSCYTSRRVAEHCKHAEHNHCSHGYGNHGDKRKGQLQ